MNAETNGRATVLVVEDERDLANLFATWLDDDYDVKTAHDAETALEAMDRSVDVVLLDRRLPDESGDVVLGRMRDRNLDSRVAMITAIDPGPDLLKLDVDQYVTKPVSREEIVSIVEELSERNEFEDAIQRYLKIASKKRTLEAEYSPDELRESGMYDVLSEELSSHRNALVDELDNRSTAAGDRWQPYPRRTTVSGLLAIATLALLLVGVHFGVPDATDRILASGSPRSNPAIAYALSFVHASDAHLFGNLAGYLIVAPLTFLICLRLGALGWFYATAITLVTAFPVGAMLVTYPLIDFVYPASEVVFLGFSQILSGAVGFSLFAFLALIGAVYDTRASVFVFGFVTSLTAGGVLHVHGASPMIPGLVAVGFFLVFIARTFGVRSDWSFRRADMWNVVLVALFGAVYALTGNGIVTTLDTDAGFTTAGHLVGLGGGFLLAFVVALLFNVFPVTSRLDSSTRRAPNRML